jgi:hypothetical protein
MPGTIVSNGILTIVFLVILFIAFLWLLIVLVVRIAVIWLLVCVAPLAFMMMVMPFTEQFFARWWKEWWKWTFMGPAVLFMLYLSSRLLKAAPVAFGSGSSTSSMLMFVLAIVSLFIAATVPLTMGVSQIWKSLSSGIQGAVKGTRGFANTLSGGRSEAALGIRRNRIQERRKKQVGNFMTGLATSKNPVASFAAGVHTQAERDEAISTQADDLSKAIRLEGIDKKRAQAEYLQATGVRRTALARIMGQEGWFDDDPQNTAAMNRFAEDYTNDAHVRNAVNGNQADLLSAARLANVANASVAGDPSGAIGATEAKTLAKALTSPGDLKTAHIDRMDRQQISELLSNPQKVKVAAEKLDAKRLAMLGRKFDELPQHIQQSISQSLDAEGQQVLGRMQQTSRDYQQKYNTARAQGNQDDMKRYATHHDWRQP